MELTINTNVDAENKKRRVENRLSNHDNLVLPTIQKPSIYNKTSFVVKSATQRDKEYIVQIMNGYEGILFECTCGDQYHVEPKRNNCKHIGGVISNIIKEYVKNNYVVARNSKKQKNSNGNNLDIENIIDQFKTMMY